jgi:hypothetical protein
VRARDKHYCIDSFRWYNHSKPERPANLQSIKGNAAKSGFWAEANSTNIPKKGVYRMKLCSALLLCLTCSILEGQTPVPLGTAGNFAVLAGSTITNTGNTIVNGNIGVSPGTAVTGFPPGVVTGGVIHAGDAVAATAQNDLTTAFVNAAGRPSNDVSAWSLHHGVLFRHHWNRHVERKRKLKRGIYFPDRQHAYHGRDE